VLGHAEWIANPAFATNRARLRKREELVPAIATVIAERSRAHWTEHFGAAGVPCAPVNTLREPWRSSNSLRATCSGRR